MDILGIRPGGRKISKEGLSLYGELELQKNANESDIKRQYRRLALRFHPDKNPGNDEAADKFKDINRAHKVLIDPEKKKLYDKHGSFGLYIADQFGEDKVGVITMLNSWWCQALFIGCGIITVCYGCLCCCCCCNCCCGRCCKDKEEDEEIPPAPSEEEFEATITQQPMSSGGAIFVIPVSDETGPPSYESLNYDGTTIPMQHK